MEDGLLDLVVSGGGAAVGSAVITIANKKFDLDREFAGIGAAAIGMFAASQTTGLLRHASLGFAGAGVTTFVVELINMLDPSWLRHEETKPPEPRQASAEEAALNAQLKAAISQLAEQQQATAGQMAALLQEIQAARAAQAATADDALTAEELAHLQAITEQLTEPERRQFVHMETHGNLGAVRHLRRELLQMPIDEAVAYLRGTVLPRRPRPRNGA